MLGGEGKDNANVAVDGLEATGADTAQRPPKDGLPRDGSSDASADTFVRNLCAERVYQRTGLGRRVLVQYKCLPWFNIAVVLALVGVFLFNAVNIVRAYVDSRNNPPSSVSQPDRSDTLMFPEMVMCSSLSNVTMSEVVFFSGETIIPFALRMMQSRDGSTYHCAFGATSQIRAAEKVDGYYVLSAVYMQAILNGDQASSDDIWLGAEVFLFNAASIVGRDLETTTYEDLNDSDGYLVFGRGMIMQGALTLTTATFYDVELGAPGPTEYTYTVNGGTGPLNPQYSGVTDPEDTAMAIVYFDSLLVREVTQTPQSFSTFFGALGGWVGLCSDGWGLLTVVLVVEKLVLRSAGGRATRSQLWWTLPQNALYETEGPIAAPARD